MVNQLSLKAKLLCLTVLMSIFTVAIGGLGYWVLSEVSGTYNHIAKINLPNATNLGYLRAGYRGSRIELRTLAVEGLSDADVERIEKRLFAEIADFDKHAKEYESVEFMPGEQERWDKLHNVWKEFKAASHDQLSLAKSKDPVDRAKFKSFVLTKCPEFATRFREAMDELSDFQLKEAADQTKQAETAAARGNLLTILAIFVGLGVSIGTGFWFATWLARQIGDIVARLSAGADEIANASVQISATSEQLSAASTEQAASLQQTSASVEEMSSMVQKNADNAESAAQTSSDGQTKANVGQEAVQEMMTAITDIDHSTRDIAQQIEESNKEIGSIIKVIADIQDKTRVINDIVFQTKLLSFNASVEAARAGEHGKGFAVVAEEVGNLAQMSGQASKEISALLASSMEGVERTIEATQRKVTTLLEENQSKVRVGTDVAQRCGQAFQELVESITSINQMASEIANASQEQATGITEINKAVRQLDQVTQQNSASAEESSAAATELAEQASSLRDLVVQLRMTVEGGSNTQSPSYSAGRATGSVATMRAARVPKASEFTDAA